MVSTTRGIIYRRGGQKLFHQQSFDWFTLSFSLLLKLELRNALHKILIRLSLCLHFWGAILLRQTMWLCANIESLPKYSLFLGRNYIWVNLTQDQCSGPLVNHGCPCVCKLHSIVHFIHVLSHKPQLAIVSRVKRNSQISLWPSPTNWLWLTALILKVWFGRRPQSNDWLYRGLSLLCL